MDSKAVNSSTFAGLLFIQVKLLHLLTLRKISCLFCFRALFLSTFN